MIDVNIDTQYSSNLASWTPVATAATSSASIWGMDSVTLSSASSQAQQPFRAHTANNCFKAWDQLIRQA